MYKIKTENHEEVLENIVYVRLQSNGVIITCGNKEEAHGVLNKDHSLIYAFKGGPLVDKYDIADVSMIALDDYLSAYLKEKHISELPNKVQELEDDNEIQNKLNYQQQGDIDFLMLLNEIIV